MEWVSAHGIVSARERIARIGVMLIHPDIDPVAIQLGGLRIHWYGIMYLVAFGGGWALGQLRTKDAFRGWQSRDMDDVLFYAALGIIFGGRLGYVFFYAPGQFLADPLMMIRVWQGGMSFHGGLVGTIVAMALFARRRGWAFFKVADFIAPLVPLGLGAGRIGNFINGNLWGKESSLPWAMVFPGAAAGGVPRHPAQLYEALLEGVVLLVILWWFSRRSRPAMTVSGLFLLGYGAFRFMIELVRVPDAHLGYLAFDWVTMGQVLTVPMILCGAGLLIWGYRLDDERGAQAPIVQTNVSGRAQGQTQGHQRTSRDPQHAPDTSKSAPRKRDKRRKGKAAGKAKNR